MRESFVFYRSFYESIKLLPKKYQLQCFDALCNYALNDVPMDSLPGTVEAILKSFKPQVDANNRKYENGCKGGRPKSNQDETKTKPKSNQDRSKAKRNVNVNDNVNENVNENENENGNGNDARARARAGALPSEGVNFFADVDSYEPIDYFASIK